MPLKTRVFKRGDEYRLAELFNEYFKDYIGYVPRTEKYWRWCFLEAPGVFPEGIFVAEKEDDIVGYAIVALTFSEKTENVSAAVIDLCAISNDAHEKLLECCLNYAKENNASALSFTSAKKDESVIEIYENLGFEKIKSSASAEEYIVVSVYDIPFYKVLFDSINTAALKSPTFKKRLSYFKCNLAIHLHCPYQIPSYCQPFTIQVKKGKIDILQNEREPRKPPDAVVKCDTSTFVSLLFGTAKPIKAIFTGKLRIYPLWKYILVFRFFSQLPYWTEINPMYPLHSGHIF